MRGSRFGLCVVGVVGRLQGSFVSRFPTRWPTSTGFRAPKFRFQGQGRHEVDWNDVTRKDFGCRAPSFGFRVSKPNTQNPKEVGLSRSTGTTGTTRSMSNYFAPGSRFRIADSRYRILYKTA